MKFGCGFFILVVVIGLFLLVTNLKQPSSTFDPHNVSYLIEESSADVEFLDGAGVWKNLYKEMVGKTYLPMAATVKIRSNAAVSYINIIVNLENGMQRPLMLSTKKAWEEQQFHEIVSQTLKK